MKIKPLNEKLKDALCKECTEIGGEPCMFEQQQRCAERITIDRICRQFAEEQADKKVRNAFVFWEKRYLENKKCQDV